MKKAFALLLTLAMPLDAWQAAAMAARPPPLLSPSVPLRNPPHPRHRKQRRRHPLIPLRRANPPQPSLRTKGEFVPGKPACLWPTAKA